jgi:hypothetical protein
MDRSGFQKNDPIFPAWMIAGGALAIYYSASAMYHYWAYRTLEAKSCYVAIFISGVLLIAAGAACFLNNKYRRPALTAAVSAAALLFGVLTGVIPCSGPS